MVKIIYFPQANGTTTNLGAYSMTFLSIKFYYYLDHAWVAWILGVGDSHNQV